MATHESVENVAPYRCPVPEAPAADALAEAVERIGDRWSLLVVAALLSGLRRFGDLLADLDGIAPNILSNRLARLEAEGLVVGEPYSPSRAARASTDGGRCRPGGRPQMLAHRPRPTGPGGTVAARRDCRPTGHAARPSRLGGTALPAARWSTT